jgi:protein involved in polysaccharide export with SLBB domain
MMVSFAGCNMPKPHADPPSAPATPSAIPPPTNNTSFGPLRVGDRVIVSLSGTPETIQPIEQEIAGDGTISLPFIGRVAAAGKTPAEVQNAIQDAYVPAWYKHLSVTVTPPLRYFFVGGEVMKGDRFPYTGPITVTGAIQAAGGFDPFANKKKVQLTQVDGNVIIVNCIEVLKHPEMDPPVYPGDKIDVPRRFW